MTSEIVDKSYFVYLLQCNDKFKSLYCGFTTDLNARLETHNKGKGAKFTRGRLPVKLIYWEQYNDKSTAMAREYQIKQLTRDQKIKLMLRPKI